MQILQFRSPSPEAAEALKVLMTDQANEWARLRWLSDAPEYVTNPFSVQGWKVHSEEPNLYWVDYGSVYANLGDSGRRIATGLMPLLLGKSLITDFPDTKLEILEVEDLIGSGYISSQ